MSGYSGNPSSTSSLQRVRMRLGSGSTSFVTDDEILAILDETNSIGRAIAAAFNVYLVNLALKVDRTVGKTSFKLSQKFRHIEKMRDYWVRVGDGGLTGSTTTATMFAGGQSKSDVNGYRTDTDLAQPSFGVGMDDNPYPNSRFADWEDCS